MSGNRLYSKSQFVFIRQNCQKTAFATQTKNMKLYTILFFKRINQGDCFLDDIKILMCLSIPTRTK